MVHTVEPTSRDLAPVVDDERWRAVTATDRDPLVRLLRRAREHSQDLTDRAVERITASVPAYAEAVTRDDLWLSVNRNLDLNLLVLAERRDADVAELTARAALGARRAASGLSISDLLRAFRVGYVVLWEGLTELAQLEGREAVDRLLEDAGRIWELLDRISSAVADSHRDAFSRRDLDTRRRSLAFIAGLEHYPADRDRIEDDARHLGVDANGAFVAAVCDGHLQRLGTGDALVAEQPDRTVVIHQPRAGARSGETILAGLLRDAGVTGVGIGLAGHGLVGARRSLLEAQRAHRCARELGVDLLSWRQDWFQCLVLEAADSLEPLVGDVVSELRGSPEGVATVTEFLAANGNLTAAARHLQLHPNTVAYRLQRLQEASGLDVRGRGGLLQAQLALVLAERLPA